MKVQFQKTVDIKSPNSYLIEHRHNENDTTRLDVRNNVSTLFIEDFVFSKYNVALR